MKTIGPFRLQQKIEEDVLGEVYCVTLAEEDGASGDPGSDESARSGLLRLFASDGLKTERFLEDIEDRRRLVGAELGEQVATSRRLGVADGRAYDFFSYVSGCSLMSQIEGATRQRERFPLEVALFIAGRLAIGLGVALRQEQDGGCLVHGFLVPHLIRISEEGSVVLGGLEVAPALADFRGNASTFAQLLPYMSPERRAGAPLHPADDVYSLGALLYQLLTLRPLASSSDLRIESRAIPSELRYFLARSVAERPRRIQSVVEWLNELKALVVQEGWASTARDLSAFLAEIDERVRPPKPDTSEITADDREEFARMIRETREKQEASSSEVAAEDDDDQPAERTSYETSVITGEDLRPLFDEGRLVRTSDVKRMASSIPPTI